MDFTPSKAASGRRMCERGGERESAEPKNNFLPPTSVTICPSNSRVPLQSLEDFFFFFLKEALLSGEHVSVNEIFTSSRLIDSAGDQMAPGFNSPNATVRQYEKQQTSNRGAKEKRATTMSFVQICA